MRMVTRPWSFIGSTVRRPAYRAVNGTCTTADGRDLRAALGRCGWAIAARAVAPPARRDQPGANGPESDQAAAAVTATAEAKAARGRGRASRPAGAMSLIASSVPTRPTLVAYNPTAQAVRVSLP